MSVINSVTIILAGILILRVAGRKSISQMSISQTVIMISIGSLIIQPLATNKVSSTLMVAIVFVLTLIVLEYLQLISKQFEKFLNGQSLIVIENGELNYKNLKKVRLTIDKLEMRLRQQGITQLADLKTVTIEINGEIGYELKDELKPLTLLDLKQALIEIGFQPSVDETIKNSSNIFNEVKHADKNVSKSKD